MKLTKTRLKQIIREEIQKLNERKIVVTPISKIKDVKKKVKNGEVTYRGLGIKDLMEGKRIQFIIPMRDRKKTAQVLKKTRLKVGQDYDFGAGKGSTFILDIDDSYRDKFLELAITNNIGVKR